MTDLTYYTLSYTTTIIFSIWARWVFHTPKEAQTKEKLLRIILENNMWFVFLIAFTLKSIYKFWRDLPDN